jgi:hypothetical protein
MDRHLARVEFVRTRRGAALRQLGFRDDDGSRWRVRGAFVLQSPPLAHTLRRLPIPVLSVDELRQLDLQAWIASLD